MTTVKQDFENVRTTLKGLRDEIRVQAHLFNMDLKKEWTHLEPKITEVEQYVDAVTDASVNAARDLEKRLLRLRGELSGLKKQGQLRSH